MSLKGRVSGNPVSKSCDLLKELETSIHHPFCKLIIAHLIGDCPQFFQSYVRTQITLSLGYSFQSFIGCHHLLIRISFLDLASVVDNGHREEARPVEIDIVIQVAFMILVKQFGTCLRDMNISQVFTQHRAILGLYQSIIVAMPGP